jgi:ribonucleoside-triphosphate reductase (formate)
MEPSVRSKIVTKRTYCRPKENGLLEKWDEVIERTIQHQRWLWERVIERKLNTREEGELEFLRSIQLNAYGSLAGRTLWLGGTELIKKRESASFNCAFTCIESIYDVVDAFWLLLQGCGVGFKPQMGALTGTWKKIDDIEVIRSLNKDKGDLEHNVETYDNETRTWTIKVGDSAESWAKAIGKLVLGKYPAKKLVLDFSEIRRAGQRLKGYGWISSGDEKVSVALLAIANILNRRAGYMLSKMDILDIINWLGSTLSSRRSAEICELDYGDSEWKEFATAKREYWIHNPQRDQSNNSLLFWEKPSVVELSTIFEMMMEAGGSEPGFINAAVAKERALWFSGVNPCCEILLPNKGFCNLVEHNLARTHTDLSLMRKVQYFLARANYRQTCVDLRDGILQESWHTNNAFYRLCGVGLTGIVQTDINAYMANELQRIAIHGAYSMAEELDLPRPKNVTTIKPSGTLSKRMDCAEGMHMPLGQFILNNINFSRYDPLVMMLAQAGYRVFEHPSDTSSVLVTIPMECPSKKFDNFHGTPVNLEPAVEQLHRYKFLMRNYCQQNVSSTIYYDPSEVPQIVDFLDKNWNEYVGVSFLYRSDPTKTAADLGYPYLPQEVVDEKTFRAYCSGLKEFDEDLIGLYNEGEVDAELDCPSGVCPAR